MAYGQTGSGKTHTMMGPDEVLSDFMSSDAKLHGIVPRASDHIMEGLRHASEESSFIVQCSYLEVYNNNLNDLIGGKQNLPMRERPGSGVVVEGLAYETVTSSRQEMDALASGNSRRVVAAMKMNARSSRGHAIFTIYVKEILAFGGEKAGKLNLVDLAGMESSKKSYAVEGASCNEMRRVEAKSINTSLYALGSVIERLSEASRKGGKDAHVPYRDSKLTRLLQDSLGGNSKSTIIVALRIESQNVEESINTLRFAQRAKAIKTKVKDNTITQHDTVKLLKLNDELKIQTETAAVMIRDLQQQLAKREEEEDERLAKAKEEAAKHAGEATDASGCETIAALLEEVAILKSKHARLLHKSILHRIIKAQSEKAIQTARDAHEEALVQLSESEELLNIREKENKELVARVQELERMVASGIGNGTLGGGVPGDGAVVIGGGGGDDQLEWQETMISDAEAELKAAMSSGDPERLKAAISNASATVAKARARGSHVLKKSQVLHGDGKTAEKPVEHKETAADALSEEERQYIRFHEICTDRKLALASRGFEVQNIFIDTLYDLALAEGVPTKEWGEFCRLQLPSPRLDEEDDADAEVPGEDGQPVAAVTYEVTDTDGSAVIKKVRKAMGKAVKLIGWRAKMGTVMRTYRSTREDHFGMDEPEGGMPAAASDEQDLSGLDISDDAYGGKSLHKDVDTHATNPADAHLGTLHLMDPAGTTPQVSEREGETRAQRYNRAQRERMKAREAARGS